MYGIPNADASAPSVIPAGMPESRAMEGNLAGRVAVPLDLCPFAAKCSFQNTSTRYITGTAGILPAARNRAADVSIDLKSLCHSEIL